MTVIKNFQCDIGFHPCIAGGSVTILMERTGPPGQYRTISLTKGLNDIKPKGGQMVRHICSDCVDIISGRRDIKAIPDTQPTCAEEAKDNG